MSRFTHSTLYEVSNGTGTTVLVPVPYKDNHGSELVGIDAEYAAKTYAKHIIGLSGSLKATRRV
jgi:hypothetical protein